MLKKFVAAFSGIIYAAKRDAGFRIQLLVGVPGIVLVLLLAWPLREIEFILLTLATFMVLITELQNASIEHALDTLHPELHDQIGRSKDMAAGAVMLAAIFALCVAVVIVIF